VIRHSATTAKIRFAVKSTTSGSAAVSVDCVEEPNDAWHQETQVVKASPH
jgi:hypothetical protein